MNKNNAEIVVSIQCLAYNHEPYIRQCLDGFVMQETNFRFEAIVHDDASTDGTAAIIREYAEKYPDIIKPIFQTENQYSKHDGTIRKIMNAKMRGKYVAMCEGDDYWIDPLKLQKQVDYLESHPDYGMCYTKAYKLYNDKIVGIWGDDDISFHSLLNLKIIPTLTRVERRSVYDSYEKEIGLEAKNWLMGDLPVVLFFSIVSKIHLINEVTGVYRVLETSASHNKNINELIKFYQSADEIRLFFINKYVKKENEKSFLLQKLKRNRSKYTISLCLQRNDLQKAKFYFKEGYDSLGSLDKFKYGFATTSWLSLFIFRALIDLKSSLKSVKQRFRRQ